MKRVVIDTNVLVSSAISSGGNPERIMNAISDKQLQLCYSQEIILEEEND
ncbi:MAG: putative toxin-antitoxin system toxin component, PIN family [Treponema sp.]|nr:putative toxin-antitoxin system toxin component, PIN family [Treponema sp.]